MHSTIKVTKIKSLNSIFLFFVAFHVASQAASISRGDQQLLDILADKGDIYSVENALRNVRDINAVDRKNISKLGRTNMTALHYAAQRNMFSIVDKLIEAKGDVNAKNNWNETPVYLVVSHSTTVEIFRLLLNAKADIDSDSNRNLLLHASGCGNTKIIKELIKLGFDVNKTNVHTHTALYLAVIEGTAITVQFLLTAGADYNIETFNKTILNHVKERLNRPNI